MSHSPNTPMQAAAASAGRRKKRSAPIAERLQYQRVETNLRDSPGFFREVAAICRNLRRR
jgi:hypothetical protein